jgi:hypothetical protein
MWSEAGKAVDDFLAEHGSGYRTVRKERLHLVRV